MKLPRPFFPTSEFCMKLPLFLVTFSGEGGGEFFILSTSYHLVKNVGATGPLGELGCMAPAQIFKDILSCLKNEDFATKENSLARFARQRTKDLIKLWLKSLLNRKRNSLLNEKG